MSIKYCFTLRFYMIWLCLLGTVILAQPAAIAYVDMPCKTNYEGAQTKHVHHCSQGSTPCQYGEDEGFQYKYFSDCDKNTCYFCIPSDDHRQCVSSLIQCVRRELK